MQDARACWREEDGGVVWFGKLLARKGNGEKKKKKKGKKDRQTEFEKQKNEAQPSHVFAGSLGRTQTVLSSVFFVLHRKAVQMFLRALSLFSCSSVPGSPALPRCSLTRRWRFFLFFLRVGLQQEGHLQASSK